MQQVIKLLLSTSIAFIVYALVGYASRFIIHQYLLPYNYLDLSYYEVFASLLIVIAGCIIALIQFKHSELKINIALWGVLFYWIFSAIPIAYFNTMQDETSFGVSWINEVVNNIWQGSSAFYTHQLLEIIYCIFCSTTAFYLNNKCFNTNYTES